VKLSEQFEQHLYQSGRRYGYGAVDFYYPPGHVNHGSCSTIITGITGKLADTLMGKLNEAYERGYRAGELVGEAKTLHRIERG